MAGTLHKLNARFVETTTEAGRHGDGGGLYLSVSKAGAKRWVFLFRWKGKLTEVGLGSADAASNRFKSLASVRAEAARNRALLGAGINPLEQKRKQEAEAVEIPTFGQMAETVITSLSSGFRNAKHRAQWEMSLGKTAVEMDRVRDDQRKATEAHTAALTAMRAKLVDQIDTADVLAVLQPIWQVKPESASRLRGRIETVLDAAKAKGFRVGENPARWRGHLDTLLSKRSARGRGHFKAMPYQEVSGLVEKLRANASISSLALEFTILTAARTKETIGARWSEIDIDRAVWTVPAERMKAGKEHRVPLSDRTITILKRLRPLAADADGFVFPGGRGKGLSQDAMRMVLQRADIDVTVHGFRSSFRDWCGDETSFAHQDVEMSLAHAIPNRVEAAYRQKDALEKRRAIMTAWAVYIEPNEAGANVVTLRRSAG